MSSRGYGCLPVISRKRDVMVKVQRDTGIMNSEYNVSSGEPTLTLKYSMIGVSKRDISLLDRGAESTSGPRIRF